VFLELGGDVGVDGNGNELASTSVIRLLERAAYTITSDDDLLDLALFNELLKLAIGDGLDLL
jgi:hypothetical protein